MEISKDATCKGSFFLGTACGTCEACKNNLERIKQSTGLISKEDYEALLKENETLKNSLQRQVTK